MINKFTEFIIIILYILKIKNYKNSNKKQEVAHQQQQLN